MNQCKGVLFDMDGVIVDSEELISIAAIQMFAEKGITVTQEDFTPFIGTGEDRYLGGVAEKYNHQLDLEVDKNRTYDIYLEAIKGELKPLDGVVDFIKHCKAKGLKIAVASSADMRKVKGNLAEIGLNHGEFDAVVSGSDIENKKPAPDIFILAAKKIGLTADQCLVIEDAVTGVTAGKAAGSKTLGITSSFSPNDLNADWHAENLANATKAILDW